MLITRSAFIHRLCYIFMSHSFGKASHIPVCDIILKRSRNGMPKFCSKWKVAILDVVAHFGAKFVV